MAKIKIRRGTQANWQSSGALATGQLGLVYRGTNTTPRLIVGSANNDGTDKSADSSYNPNSKSNTPYIAPDPDIYTDDHIQVANSNNGHTVSSNPLDKSVLRNIIAVSSSSAQPSANLYSEGTILVVYTP